MVLVQRLGHEQIVDQVEVAVDRLQMHHVLHDAVRRVGRQTQDLNGFAVVQLLLSGEGFPFELIVLPLVIGALEVLIRIVLVYLHIRVELAEQTVFFLVQLVFGHRSSLLGVGQSIFKIRSVAEQPDSLLANAGHQIELHRPRVGGENLANAQMLRIEHDHSVQVRLPDVDLLVEKNGVLRPGASA